ncbi:sugar transferase [Mesotoga sp.]|uniref:sugar transferase n=1 Tax=Mesotoga sp. TaxID=2053577 RepID=UPI00345E476D
MSAVAGVILFFLDVSFLFVSVHLVSFVSFLMPIGQFAIVIVNLISFYAFRLYDLQRIKRTQNLLSNALLSVVVSGVLVVLIFFLPRLVLEQISRRALLYESVLILVYLYLSRRLASSLIRRSPIRFLAVGCDAYFDGDCSVKTVPNSDDTVDFVSLDQEIQDFKPDFVVVPVDSKLVNVNILPLDLPVISSKQVPEIFSLRLDLAHFRPEELYSNAFSSWYASVKNVIEWIVALVLSVLSSPLVLISAIAVVINDPGNPFFVQERLGKNGKPFKIVKIRTMRKEGDHTSWTKDKDDRIFAAGKVIRKLRFDELPQFWNVLRGDMAIVGPRPETPVIAEGLAEEVPFYSLRMKVKPGIRGWAQLNWGYDRTIEDVKMKLSYDLFYIKNRSIMFEQRIKFQTIETMLLGKGAR